jgi:hypothetical protein
VKKNGILQVDYTNTLMASGLPLEEAVYRANLVRLRPILMTTVTLIAGMTPIALGKGPGASSRASMAKVIIGGQALSLVITLLIVPVAYVLFDGATAFFRDRLPRGFKERQSWALCIVGGASALGLWFLLMVLRLMGGLPGWLGPLAGLAALGGLVSLGLGAWLYRRALAAPPEAAA